MPFYVFALRVLDHLQHRTSTKIIHKSIYAKTKINVACPMYWHFCYDRFLGDSVNNAVALIVSLMSDQELDHGYTTLTGSVRLKSITNHLLIVVTSLLALSRVGGGNVFHGRAIRRAIITTSREASPVSNGLPHLSSLIRQFVSPVTSVITDCPSVRRLELVQGIGMLRGGDVTAALTQDHPRMGGQVPN